MDSVLAVVANGERGADTGGDARRTVATEGERGAGTGGDVRERVVANGERGAGTGGDARQTVAADRERAAGPGGDARETIVVNGERAAGTGGDAHRTSGDARTMSASRSLPARERGLGDGLNGPRRWVILGTGTGVGKTFAATALVRLLAHRGTPVAGLKPIETGLGTGGGEAQDAAGLAAESFHVKLPWPHPLYAFAAPIAPSRAARAAGELIDLRRVVAWVDGVTSPGTAPADVVVETAGGVFSPLHETATNFDLARALEPCTWLLVAPDRLGVLHDVGSCLLAMEALGRRPDYLVLSAPEQVDASTGTNHEELARNPQMPPLIRLPRHDPTPLRTLLDRGPA
jgi:dethiobiotin synthetase